jgi:DNA-binding response OmpR family regulator
MVSIMLAPCILVVDDEALIHLMLEAELTDAGFTVIKLKTAWTMLSPGSKPAAPTAKPW